MSGKRTREEPGYYLLEVQNVEEPCVSVFYAAPREQVSENTLSHLVLRGGEHLYEVNTGRITRPWEKVKTEDVREFTRTHWTELVVIASE